MRQDQYDPTPWRLALWLVFFGGVLFFWPTCLDRYLAPRFLFASAALAVAFVLLWRHLKFRLDGFDLALLGWYGFNLLSVCWAHSWSEGVFYAQKTALLFSACWLARRALEHPANKAVFRNIFHALTLLVSAVLLVQLALALGKQGLDNEQLYDYASGLSGNKSLASELLFLLLAFLLMFDDRRSRRLSVLLLVLILLLQTRTVYLALALSSVFYLSGRLLQSPDGRALLLKRALLPAVVLLGLLAGWLAWNKSDSSLAQRLNPLTYLDSQTANERRFVWYKTDLLVQEHPWLGVGNGSWKLELPGKSLKGGYRQSERNVVFTRAHNDYLEIRAELGLLGLLWWSGLFVWLLWLGVRKTFRPEGSREGLAAATALLGYALIQFFDFPRERIEMQLLLGLAFAWVLSSAGKERRGFECPPRLAAIGLAVMLGFNLVIGAARSLGEHRNLQLLQEQSKNKWPAVVQLAVAAENPFYEYTDVAIPLAWHEGIGWYQQGEMDKAKTAFEKAARLNPWSFQVLNNYAAALVQNGELRSAVPWFEKVLEINPSYDDAKFSLGFVHFQLGEYQQAMDWVARVDTIANAANPQDKAANQRILQRKAEFVKTIQDKLKE